MIAVRVIATGEVLGTGAVHALTPFDALRPDFQVWCARDGEERPVIFRRDALQRVA